MRFLTRYRWAFILCFAVLSACGGGGSGDQSVSPIPAVAGSPPVITMARTGVQSILETSDFRFGGGAVLGTRYYLADPNNASVDIFDTSTGAQVGSFKDEGSSSFGGFPADNNGEFGYFSGEFYATPKYISVVGNLLYVSNGRFIGVFDPAQGRIVNTIAIPNSFGRVAQAGCLDPVHNIFMQTSWGRLISASGAPQAHFIDTTTQQIIGSVSLGDPQAQPNQGQPNWLDIGQCRYDTATDSFYVGRTLIFAGVPEPKNAYGGDVVVLPGAGVRKLAAGIAVKLSELAGVRSFPVCAAPRGMALGPANQIAVSCRGYSDYYPFEYQAQNASVDSSFQIMDKTDGTLVAWLDAGGGGTVEYDAASNRYYVASALWLPTAYKTIDQCSYNPCSPSLFVIDAGSRSIAARVNTGKRADWLTFDPVTHKAFIPVSYGSAANSTPPPHFFARTVLCTYCGSDPAGLLIFTIN